MLRGLGGNDKMNGKAGADIMYGGTGNDTYYVDDAGDQVIELKGEGNDTVYASVSYKLAASSYVQSLVLTGSGDIAGTGNGIANTMVGNTGDNVLKGGGGDDVIIGGVGYDVMTGGAGADTFVFQSGSDTTYQIPDYIADLTDEDFIDLSIFADPSQGTAISTRYIAMLNITIFDVSDGASVDSVSFYVKGNQSDFDNFIFGGG